MKEQLLISCRIWFLMVVWITLTHVAVAQGRAQLPEHWEEHTDTRFEPRIELVVQSLSFFPSKDDCRSAQYAWFKWGPEAVPVVQALRESPEWNDLRYAFTVLLCVCPLDDAPSMLNNLFYSTLRSAPDTSNADLQPTPESGNFLDTLTRYNKEAALEMLRKLATHDSPELRLVAASRLGTGTADDVRTASSILESLAESESETIRERVAYLYLARMDEAACARAVDLVQTLSPESQKTFSLRYDAMQGELRANQPMSRILELEAAHDSPEAQN